MNPCHCPGSFSQVTRDSDYSRTINRHYGAGDLSARILERLRAAGKDPATITRDDGSKQVTYKGLPLYRFAQDAAPGDTKGDGFANGLWAAAKP